jgi:hypothetical protein
MCPMKSATAELFIWLAAVAMPLQGQWPVGCQCASAEKSGTAAEAARATWGACGQRTREVKSPCCRAAKPACSQACVAPRGCRLTVAEAGPSVDCPCEVGCRCGADCRCVQRDRSPPEPLVPTRGESRSPSIVDSFLGPLAIGGPSDPEAGYTSSGAETRVGVGPSGARMCVFLCRHVL